MINKKWSGMIMKKKIFGLFVLALLSFGLVACGNNNNEEERQEHTPIEIEIRLADDEFLATFYDLHHVDYGLAHVGYWEPIESDIDLVIWANVPLYDFALLAFKEVDFVDGEVVYAVTGTYGKVAVLEAGHGFVITSYYDKGTMPWSGIRFVDANGETRHMAMQQSMMDGLFRLQEIRIMQ